MPLHDCRSVHLPYCLKRLPDGRYVVLNREYKPLGFKTEDWIEYEKYPIAVTFKRFGAKTAARISYNGSPDLDWIYFYNDGCYPTASAKDMQAYLKRLALFAKLEVV